MTQLSTRLLFAALLLAAAPAFAQVAPATPALPGDGPATDTGSDPCTVAPGDATRDESLSSQLAECGGVLAPPPTGSTGIEAPVPDPDPQTTPVLPPSTLPSAPNGDDAT